MLFGHNVSNLLWGILHGEEQYCSVRAWMIGLALIGHHRLHPALRRAESASGLPYRCWPSLW